jgi:hypothetical protein
VAAPRLKTGLRVAAILRRYDIQGIAAFQRRRGDADAGALVIKLALGQGRAHVLIQTYDRDGHPAWMRQGGAAPIDDAAAEAAIEKAIGRDPDLYVIEIEDTAGRLLLDAPVLDD